MLMTGIALLGLAGCSIGADKEAPPTAGARGASEQVAVAVNALNRAVQARDWRTLCDRLFTRAARRRAGGADCVRLVRSSAGHLSGARVQLLAIELGHGSAQARVRSSAQGQAPLTDTITLRRSGGGYRIDSLR